jgi:hypothetical protein
MNKQRFGLAKSLTIRAMLHGIARIVFSHKKAQKEQNE